MTDPKSMPERIWLTAPASESLREIIPYQFDHDERDTEYIRADLVDPVDAAIFQLRLAFEFRKGYQQGLIDSHNDALDIVADHQKESDA